MERNRKLFWLEIFALGTAVAGALGLMIATLGAVGPGFSGVDPLASAETVLVLPGHRQQAEPPQKQVFEGMLSCSRCDAKHSATIGKNAADCVRICAHLGASFTLVEADKVYQLEGDANLMKRLAARRVRISGMLEGSTIHASSVATTD